ncbi:autotransporter domain-containing protein [Methylomonas albis]|uniref:Autotransporter domain-containing protein n=1 Tax=Methylomonas albis TaxID=1854563 RepID=A0ABR9D4K4_9GAMM|nr:autotransporter domain-containing protein [Methylomonas albis]MBD9357173.1 autotransporter domain-containing protein [Methylomonas albis]
MILPLTHPENAACFCGIEVFPKRSNRIIRHRVFTSKAVLLAAAAVLSLKPFAVDASTLAFIPSTYSVNEAGGNLQVIVEMNSGYGGSCIIEGDVVASGGSASSGSDYNLSGGRVTFDVQNGSSQTQSVVINIIDDTLVESAETINLSIQNSSELCLPGAVPGAGAQAVVTIVDNDVASASTTQTTPTTPTTSTPSTPNLTADPTFTPNQQSIYEGLTSACSGASGDLLNRCNEINNADLNAVIPDAVAAQGSAAVDFGFKQFSVIHGRIVNLRNSQQQSSSLLGYSTININGETIPVGKALMTALGPARGGAAGDDPNDQLFRDSPLGFFLKGQFNVGEKANTGSERGFKADRKAVTFGLDYSVMDELVLGAAFGYGSTDTNYNLNSGSMSADAFEFSSYGSYFLPQSFYIDWIMSYALHSFDINRRIQYTGFDNTATSAAHGDQYGFSLGFGKDFALQSFVINPYLRLDYSKTKVDSYRESGGGGLAMEFAGQSIDSATSTIGGQASNAISTSWGVLSPGVRFEWVHQYLDESRLIQARFSQAAAGTGRFSVKTDTPDRDYFNIGTSLALSLPEGRAGFLRYEYRLGQAYITDHTIELGARIPF